MLAALSGVNFRLVARVYDRDLVYTTAILFFTALTSGTDHAARSASCRSARERTVPLRTTSLSLVATMMRLASTSALRRSASLIMVWISAGEASFFGLIWISHRRLALTGPAPARPGHCRFQA
jgi:hypothetical protein